MAQMAGHDIDYIAVSGALHPVGPADQPIPPLNLVGDFGGGGMLLVVGVLAAIVNARATGRGQAVDAAMVDGSALLTTSHHGYMADGWWSAARASNLLDGAAPFYSTYATKDGQHVAVGALEPHFFAALLEGLDIDADQVSSQNDRAGWEKMRTLFAERFALRTRDEWAAHFAGTDACVAPILSLREAPDHPQIRARSTFVVVDGVPQPAPAPRFSETPPVLPSAPPALGADTSGILDSLGFSPEEVGKLVESGAVA